MNEFEHLHALLKRERDVANALTLCFQNSVICYHFELLTFVSLWSYVV